MDAYKTHLHDECPCKEGIYCPYDRPRPKSSAGARRLRASKTLSRRVARARLSRDLLRRLND